MSLNIKFLDVNHGSATYIETDTLAIFFDFGKGHKTNPSKFINKKDNKTLIVSHPHIDHIQSFDTFNPLNIFYNFSINRNIPLKLIEDSLNNANTVDDKLILKRYIDIIQKATVECPEEISPLNPDFNGNVKIRVFGPPSNLESNDLNDYSLAMYLEYEGFKILLTGDNTIKNTNLLLENPLFIEISENIDILLAPHHGRCSCYNSDFVNYVNPIITIISDKSKEEDKTAVSHYSKYSRGRFIKNNGKIEWRKCLTTRNDGIININIENKIMEISCITL